MTWFKVDDRFHDHKKVRRVRRSHPEKGRDVAPFGLWVLGGSWSGLHHTGGFIPTEVLLEWDDDAEALAGRLVSAGLWLRDEVDDEPGYRFHNWTDRNPGEGEDYADYSARGNHIRWHVKRKKPDPECPLCTPGSSRSIPPDSGGESGAIRGGDSPRNRGGDSGGDRPPNPPVPTRPDPTRPVLTAANAAAAMPPPPLDALWTKTVEAGLTVRWDKLTAEHTAEIAALIDIHGIPRLVSAAKKAYRRDDPPAYAQAWLGDWRALTPLAAVPRPAKCQTHRLEQPCRSCAADAKAAAS